jgi:Transposase DDE domain
MRILAKAGGALQKLLGDIAQKAADASAVIQRKRVFTDRSLARTFVLGFLQHPDASDEELAQMAGQCGAAVTPQAIDQRHSPKLVNFLKRMFEGSVKVVVGSDKALAPILERFLRVIVLDSTTITLPDSQKDEYAGCGGSYGFGASALKLQTELDLRSGAVSHVEIETGRSTDNATSRQHVRHGPGSLQINDLGYFNVEVFAEKVAAGEHFLSRLQFGTGVMLRNGASVELLPWLRNQAGKFIDQPIILGKGHRLACRLIAWRLPEEQANRRRQKLRQDHRDKYGREPSAERLAWCDWTILVTSVPVELLTPAEAVVMYRARWQVELLFKRWKSQNLVAELSGSTDVRKMVRVWSRLLAALVQHWLVIASVWGDPTKSLSKACEAIRSFVSRLAASLDSKKELERMMADIGKTLAKTCRQNPRSKPSTFELLNDVDLLDYSLT